MHSVLRRAVLVLFNFVRAMEYANGAFKGTKLARNRRPCVTARQGSESLKDGAVKAPLGSYRFLKGSQALPPRANQQTIPRSTSV